MNNEQHDPMCWFADSDRTPAAAVNDGWPCICHLIARVREDGITPDDLKKHHDDGYEAGRAHALRDAVEAVKALPPITDAYPTSSPAGGEGLSIVTRTWLCSRDAAIAAIEALGGER